MLGRAATRTWWWARPRKLRVVGCNTRARMFAMRRVAVVARRGRAAFSTGALHIRADAVVIAQHKPYSFLSPSTAPTANKQFAIDLLNARNQRGGWPHRFEPRDLRGLECAGRLDADSTGLLVWTDDPALADFIIAPDTTVEKEYLVRVEGHEDWDSSQLEWALERLRGGGMLLDGRPLRPAGVDRLNPEQLRFTLREGRHRQIRRMCGMVGLHVTAIKRVRIGRLRLASLGTGCWTSLTPANAASLFVHRPRDAAGGAPRPAPPAVDEWAASGSAAKSARRRRARQRRREAELDTATSTSST